MTSVIADRVRPGMPGSEVIADRILFYGALLFGTIAYSPARKQSMNQLKVPLNEAEISHAIRNDSIVVWHTVAYHHWPRR